MVLKFYNTLGKRKQSFRSLKKGEVSMYNCGPTVYDYAHIGNFRTYMFADLLRRYLEWKGFKVKQVMNITDVGHMTEDDVADASGEDKIEKKAREQRKSPREIASFYTKVFLEDWRKLNMLEPMARPVATEYVKDMIRVIEMLIKNGNAYEVNGSVYFHVPSFPKYGRLSGNTIEQLKAGAGGRVERNPEKRNQLDFSLWVRNPKHLMQWGSPWGRGYPGWHIECSAMSMKLLGKTIDIHTGGEDNIFPHHDCEIAQSECANKKPFVKYWMHSRHLKVEGKKMSKSLGNFYRLDDLLEKGFSPEAVRYLLMSAHYRTKLNLTEKGLNASEATVKRFREFVQAMATHTPGKSVKGSKKVDGYIKAAREGFEKAMDDDLGIPDALAAVFRFMTRVNRDRDAGKLSRGDASKAYGFMIDIDRVLGLGLENLPTRESVPDEVKLLAEEREQLRKSRDFKGADGIRDRIRKRGFVVEDTPQGPVLKKA
jgi:cysteinyl-tRNA synthetase